MSSLASVQTGIPGSSEAHLDELASVRPPQQKQLFTEIVDLDQLTQLRPAWADLLSRALEPNVFLEPGFAIPLFQHCAQGAKIEFLLAWAVEGTNSRHKLLGLLPLSKPGLLFGFFARGATHCHAPLGTPLFDQDRGLETLGQMIGWLRRHHRLVRGLLLSHLPRFGPTFGMLQLYAEAAGTALVLFDECERAALSKAVTLDTFWKKFISAKRRKRYRQQRRRLDESGEVTYRTTRDPGEIRRATEAFLLLEYKGWKGARKTALLSSSPDTTFLRSMTRAMALEGKCRIDSLEVDVSPIAMCIMLESGDRSHCWKISHDERFAPHSPGVQLVLEMTQTQLASPSIALTDSCASADHPMINHLWRERMAMADVLLPVGPNPGLFFRLGVVFETLRRQLRQTAKSALKRLRNR